VSKKLKQQGLMGKIAPTEFKAVFKTPIRTSKIIAKHGLNPFEIKWDYDAGRGALAPPSEPVKVSKVKPKRAGVKVGKSE